ncbi:hypothetical protein EYC80_009586 [Monilinia laxa]|nr:hypothetical protein EYC80_009586 [Monilinia laxa]
MRLFLANLDLEAETKDTDTEYLKYWINIFWKMEIRKGKHNDLLIYHKMPYGFTWDRDGDALFDACLHYSDHFVDAPFGQGIARRAQAVGPGKLHERQKSMHDALTIGNPIRVGPENILGDRFPRRTGVERTPSPPSPPLPSRPIIGGVESE